MWARSDLFPYFERSTLAPRIATVGRPMADDSPCLPIGGRTQSGTPQYPTQARRGPAAMTLTYDLIARRIDHSLLGPTMTEAELEQGCRLAAAYEVASVCIKPFAVSMARSLLAGTVVNVGTTIGFPHGGHSTAIKVLESRRAIEDGA